MELDAFLLVKEPFNETSGYINQPLDDKVRLNAALSNFMWEEADACTKNHTGMIHIHKTIETIQTDCPLFVEEVCSNIPKITIAGFNELILENYKGILEYEEFFASISTYIGIVNINGFNLNLEKMTNDDIKITGKIESIDIERTEE